MAYEVWETKSGNFAGAYASCDKALRAVYAFVRRNGSPAAESLSLVHAGRRGKYTTVASGRNLVEMAFTSPSAWALDRGTPDEAAPAAVTGSVLRQSR